MRRFIALNVIATMVLMTSSMALAENFNYEVSPSALASGTDFANGQGGYPFGYDHDSEKPIGSTEAGPNSYPGCFWSDVQGSAAGGGRDYTSIRLSPKDIFEVDDVTIGELAEISYCTKWVSDLDWQLKIYTEGEETGDWYGHRFNFTRPEHGDNNWNLSSTDNNLLVNWIETKTTGGSTTIPDSGQLSDLDTNYGDKKILFIDIIAGYATNSPPANSYLDDITIELTNGDVASIDLTADPDPNPVPEPSTITLLLAVALFGWFVRKR